MGSTTFDFDAKYRLTDLTHFDAAGSVLVDYQYTRDLADQLTQEIHHGQTYDYTRDGFGQLLTATVDGQLAEEYEYDDNGNRVAPATVTGADNRLQEDANFTYEYDAEGNLIRRTDKLTNGYTLYEYDHVNRLVKAEVYDSADNLLATVENTYDVFDRQITRSHDQDGAGPQAASVRHTVYDGAHAWADYDASGNVTDRYLFNDGTDFIAARWRPGEGTAFYLTDHLGTVREIIDTGGNVINEITYDSFGRILSQTDPLAGDRFTFTGREWDPELGFYYYRARFYDPTTGRFISQDPIGFAAGDTNLYRYVGNSPLDYVDPSGNVALTECAIVRIATVAVDVLCPALQLYLRGEFEGKSASEIVKLTANQALFGGDLSPPKDATVEQMLAHTIERTTHFLNTVSTILPSGSGMAVQLTLKAISLATVARSLANVIANDQLLNVMALAEGYVMTAYKYAKDPGATFQQAMTAIEKKWDENKTDPLFWSQIVCGAANLALMVFSAKARCFVAGTPIVVGILPPDEAIPDEAEQELLGITVLDVVAGVAIAGAVIIARRRKEEDEEDQQDEDPLDGIDSIFEDFDLDCLNEQDCNDIAEECSGSTREKSEVSNDTAFAEEEPFDVAPDNGPCIVPNQPVAYKPASPEIVEPTEMPQKEKLQPLKRNTGKRTWLATLSLFGCLLIALVAGAPRWMPMLDGREAEATVSALPPTTSSSSTQPRLVTKPIEDIHCGDRIPSELPEGLLPDDEPEPDPDTWRLVDLELTKDNGDKVEVKLLRPMSWLQQAGAIDHGTFPLNVEELDIKGDAAILKVLPCPPIQKGKGQVVTGTFRHTCDEFVHLHIEGEPKPIICTTGHPIWSETQKEFVDATDLKKQETIRLTSGTFSQVTGVEHESGTRNVFNFEVNRTHVYHVGSTGLLVHNALLRECKESAYRGAPSTLGKFRAPGFTAPKIRKNRHHQLTNDRYILDAPGMSPHTTGSLLGGKSQFLYKFNHKEGVLDAAAYADDAGLWVGNKAKIIFDKPIGVHGGTGMLTNVLNIYRTNTGFIHAAPGSPQ